jgi:hypothetical protein
MLGPWQYIILQHPFQEDDDEVEEDDENAELIAKGKVKASVYLKYFRSGASAFVLFLLVLILIIGQMASSGADFWVTYWEYRPFSSFITSIILGEFKCTVKSKVTMSTFLWFD